MTAPCMSDDELLAPVEDEHESEVRDDEADESVDLIKDTDEECPQ